MTTNFLTRTLWAGALLIATCSFAQDAVRLTVGATDGTGAPVSTLTQSDFTVQDAGKPRPLTSFTGPKDQPAAPAQLPPNEFSNASDVSQGGAIFVVLDTIHTRYLDERDIRELILRFLARSAQAKHAVTLGILSDKGLRLYHDYRTGPAVLLAALAKAGLGGLKGTPPPPGLNDTEITAEAARLIAFSKGDGSNPTPQDRALRSSADMPLIMFQDVAHAAYGLPGRKMLVWVTNVVPFDIDPKSMQFTSPKESNRGAAVNGVAAGGSKDAFSADQMKHLVPLWRKSVRALFDGGVAVYPVEARGVFSSATDSFTVSVMKILAQLTGGKAYFGSNDPFPEILQLSNGNTAGYAMTFAGDTSGNDFHRVAVTNTAGAQLTYALGYFPSELTPKAAARDETSLAMQSPLEYTAIKIKVAVGNIEDAAGGKKKVNLVISLPGDSSVLNEAEKKVDVGLLAVAKNAKGEVVGRMNEGAGGQFPPEAVAQIKQLGFQLKRSMEVSPGDSTLHFLVRNNQTGQMGSVLFPLKIQ